MKAEILAIIVGVVLGGCSLVGPDYRVADTALVRTEAANGPFQAPGARDQAVPEHWRLYDDPEVEQLVREALAANTDLRVATAHLRKALAVEASVTADSHPHASVEVDARRHQEALESSPLGVRPGVVNDAGVGLTISYDLDLFGKLARAEQAARADSDSALAALELARTAVVAQTLRAYVQGCSATHQLAVARQQLALQARSVEVVERLAAVGSGSKSDVDRARTQLASLRANLPPFEAARDGAAYRLAALLGKTSAQFSNERPACSREPRLAQPIPAGDGGALLRRRPDVRQAERQLAAATARIGVAMADLYPDIRLGASAGLAGRFGDLAEQSASHFAFGPLLSWTIPDSGARARVKAAEADSDAALANFDGVVLGALRETETALTNYSRALVRNADLRDARDHAKGAAVDEDRLYRAGQSPYLSSLDANRTLATAEAELAASDAQVALDQVDLFRALGGGWRAAVSANRSPVTASSLPAAHVSLRESPTMP
ncbi:MULTISPECIES: efflux transporter outer membrane subunit [unclassified Pseudomonas]|uniref:efflux transporter outer membrane subunit n=1 Tax=unclassified Pseudomonas TaxID=196821 RepID=UPI001AE1BDED|nr:MULTISPECIES: efflux transporter outer membrane subunit [unclassified Pseudomonas]MBP2271381.1 NodT family efflux transporter outer membrane factor (OMF) lipoprotein [Pseudomonas sp. BP6]MBP2289648.1 NodT family efflux transporter outer membrane factor (OMF) lipoprotein [Pseudomonas sp. BP7]HDS1697853.1 efflux transporter outer membrane subunit [Pseudomonas putida]HDS1703076.1 efflux transporter outer membrane subunit [Pseudomonas putida]